MACLFFVSSRRRHTRLQGDWSSDVCSSDLHRTRATVKTLPVNVRRTLLMVVSPPWWYRIASNRACAPNALDRARRPVKGNRSEERRVGKGVDLGGRRIIKKKKRRLSVHRDK